MMIYKKTIMLLAILALLTSGFLPYGFSNRNKVVKNSLVSHAELCCCGNIARECRDCCCSDNHAENENTDRTTVTITACGGTSNDIITISKLDFLSPLASFVQYIHVATTAEAATLQSNDVLRRQPYKPPEPQLLSNLT